MSSPRNNTNQIGCDLLLISPFPDMEALKKLITSQAAYVRSDDKLFYINIYNNQCVEIPLEQIQRDQFDEKLSPNKQPKSLSNDQLKLICSITGHTHHCIKTFYDYDSALREALKSKTNLNGIAIEGFYLALIGKMNGLLLDLEKASTGTLANQLEKAEKNFEKTKQTYLLATPINTNNAKKDQPTSDKNYKDRFYARKKSGVGSSFEISRRKLDLFATLIDLYHSEARRIIFSNQLQKLSETKNTIPPLKKATSNETDLNLEENLQQIQLNPIDANIIKSKVSPNLANFQTTNNVQEIDDEINRLTTASPNSYYGNTYEDDKKIYITSNATPLEEKIKTIESDITKSDEEAKKIESTITEKKNTLIALKEAKKQNLNIRLFVEKELFHALLVKAQCDCYMQTYSNKKWENAKNQFEKPVKQVNRLPDTISEELLSLIEQLDDDQEALKQAVDTKLKTNVVLEKEQILEKSINNVIEEIKTLNKNNDTAQAQLEGEINDLEIKQTNLQKTKNELEQSKKIHMSSLDSLKKKAGKEFEETVGKIKNEIIDELQQLKEKISKSNDSVKTARKTRERSHSLPPQRKTPENNFLLLSEKKPTLPQQDPAAKKTSADIGTTFAVIVIAITNVILWPFIATLILGITTGAKMLAAKIKGKKNSVEQKPTNEEVEQRDPTTTRNNIKRKSFSPSEISPIKIDNTASSQSSSSYNNNNFKPSRSPHVNHTVFNRKHQNHEEENCKQKKGFLRRSIK